MNIKVLLKRLDVLEQKVSNLEDENTLTKRFINFTKAASVFLSVSWFHMVPQRHFPPILLNLLRAYFREHKPTFWLFEGQGGGQYSAKSIQEIFRRAVKATGLPTPEAPHIRCSAG